MKKMVTVEFLRCLQDSQDFGSDDDHMVSRIWFNITVDGTRFEDLHCDIKQVVGGDFETDPLEVSRPDDYAGPYNHTAFAAEASMYYRSLVGSKGRGIHIGAGAKNIRMRNGRFEAKKIVQFEASEGGAGW